MINTPFKVVINNRNRLTTTKNMVETLLRLNPETRIVILDNDSEYVPLLKWYLSISRNVDIRMLPNYGHMALWESKMMNEIEEDYLVYTDSDIELNPNLPSYYQLAMYGLASKYNFRKVGLALRIDDIPDYYSFKQDVIGNESGWWKNQVENNVYLADTDTTFALIAKGNEQFESLRIAGDFQARHIPWYQDLKSLNQEEKFYLDNLGKRTLTQYSKKHKEIQTPSVVIQPKVSCVMTTFKRFTCVERSLSMFLYQDYQGPKEFILFNTDEENPYVLGAEFESFKDQIKIINNSKDYITGQEYTNVGAIRRDAITHTSGDLYICWDDDDIFLPWNIKMCVEGIQETGKKAWKPIKSFFASPNEVKLVQNVLEASVISSLEEVKKHGFLLESGKEHLSWYTALRDDNQLDENNINSIPGYCFNWGDVGDVASHKQSGDIDNPENFENHKKATLDLAKRPLKILSHEEMRKIWNPYMSWFNDHKGEYSNEYYKRYVKIYEEHSSNLIFLTAQPDIIYFQWQIEVQIVNFRKHNISDQMHIIVWHPKNNYLSRKAWMDIQTKYPEVNISLYEDDGVDLNLYLSNIRPHSIKKHFNKNKELLENKAIFYHDSDIIFNYLPNFNKLLEGNVVWQSDTSGYLDYGYLRRKEIEGNIPENEAISKMAEIGGISLDVIKSYQGKTGGAQILLKGNIDEDFWNDVEQMGYKIRYEFIHSDERPVNPNSINNKYFKAGDGLNGEQKGFQSWCADMWAINFALWKRGIETNISDELDFSWGSSDIGVYYEKSIFHNAGVVDNSHSFFKGDFRDSSPIGIKNLTYNSQKASCKYVDAIREVNT